MYFVQHGLRQNAIPEVSQSNPKATGIAEPKVRNRVPRNSGQRFTRRSSGKEHEAN